MKTKSKIIEPEIINKYLYDLCIRFLVFSVPAFFIVLAIYLFGNPVNTGIAGAIIFLFGVMIICIITSIRLK